MIKGLFAAASLAFALLIGSPAAAGPVRFPATGDPAFVVTEPAGWTHQIVSDDSLAFLAPDSTAKLMISIRQGSGKSLDVQIDEALAQAQFSPARNKAFTAISGHLGYEVDTEGTNPLGVRMKVHSVFVTLGGGRVAMATTYVAELVDPARQAEVQAMLAGLTLTSSSP